MEYLAYLSCFVLLCIFAGYFIWYFVVGTAPYVPSTGKDRKQLLEEAAELLPRLKLKSAVEPGAGDANITFALARRGYKKATAVEMVAFLTLFARLKRLLGRYRNVEIINGDIYKIDFSKYDLAVCYLFPEIMEKLEPKMFSQMPKGSFIISNTFMFRDHKPVRTNGRIKVYEVI